MKIFLLCLFLSTLYADDAKLASDIFYNIVQSITKKAKPKVYIHFDIEALKKYPGLIVRVEKCREADIVLLSSLEKIPASCNDKILFGTRYFHLKNSKVVGSFFWQKGRPNILFYQKRLDRYNLKLDAGFNKYIEP